MTYLSPEKFRRLNKGLASVLRAHVPGDVVEFGGALGGSGMFLADRARKAGRQFHGFDVFGMIPAPTSEKDDAKSRARYKVIAEGRSEGIDGDQYYGYRANLYDEVCTIFRRHGVPVDGVTVVLHKGLFEEILLQYSGTVIAFAHIDCDWYDPVSFCLNQVAGRLAKGGVIVLDDDHDYGGCRQATDEFLSRGGFSFLDGPNVLLTKA